MKKLVPFLLLLPLFSQGLVWSQGYRLSDVPEADESGKLTPREKEEIEQREKLSNQVAEEFYEKGLEALDEGRVNQAETFFDRALTLDPAHEGAQLGLQKVILAQEELQAEKPEPTTKKEDPKNALRKGLEADLEQQLGKKRFMAARGTAKKLLALHPDHEKAAAALQTAEKKLFRREIQRATDLEKAGKPEEALKALERARRFSDEPLVDAKVRDIRAKMAEKVGRRAEEFYLAALKATQVGHNEKAIEYCRKALEINPDHARARKMLQRLQPPSAQ